MIIENGAGERGGVWYMNVRTSESQKEQFFFKRTKFDKSSSEKSFFY